MELLFTFVENYRNIKNQGFNFSSEFLIEFDFKTNILQIQKNNNFISSFFGKNISNTTVIVGENGVGKSSALDIEMASFYIIRKNNILELFSEKTDYLDKIQFFNPENIEIIKKSKFDTYDTFFVKYSNFVDSNLDKQYSTSIPTQNIFELTTNKVIQRIPYINTGNFHTFIDDEIKPKARKLRMILSEIENQIQFLFHNNNADRLTFQTPELLKIYFNLDGELEYLFEISNQDSFTHQIYRFDEAKLILDKFLKYQLSSQISKRENRNGEFKLKVSKEEYCFFVIRWSLFFSFVNSFSTPNSDAHDYPTWFKFNENWHSEPIETWFDFFFEKYIIQEDMYSGSKYNKQIQAWSENALKFFEGFKELIDKNLISIELLPNRRLFHDSRKSFGINISFDLNISDKENHSFIYERLIFNYNKIQEPENFRNDNLGFLSFYWRGVSSGEMAMFRLFSRINQIRKIIVERETIESPRYNRNKISHLIFLLDEGDLGFHPGWQQKYLSLLIDNLPNIFKDLEIKSIQLILTTHSPFILSDVTNNHVIFLEKSEKKECSVSKNPLSGNKNTFGANIHSLLSNGFFMKDGLMGEFAKRKINEIIDSILEGKIENISNRNLILNQIGEPLIKKRILDLVSEKMTIDEKIKKHEIEIELLRKSRNDSN